MRLPEPTEQPTADSTDTSEQTNAGEGLVEEFAFTPGPSVPQVAESLPLSEPKEIHYFHGAIGGHYSQHSPYEVGILVVVGVFSAFTVVVLLIQCVRLFRVMRKDTRTYTQLFNAPFTDLARPAHHNDYIDLELATKMREQTPQAKRLV